MPQNQKTLEDLRKAALLAENTVLSTSANAASASVRADDFTKHVLDAVTDKLLEVLALGVERRVEVVGKLYRLQFYHGQWYSHHNAPIPWKFWRECQGWVAWFTNCADAHNFNEKKKRQTMPFYLKDQALLLYAFKLLTISSLNG